MTTFDELEKELFNDNRNGSFIQVAKGQCFKCKMPIYYPPMLEKKIVCCPYCEVKFK